MRMRWECAPPISDVHFRPSMVVARTGRIHLVPVPMLHSTFQGLTPPLPSPHLSSIRGETIFRDAV